MRPEVADLETRRKTATISFIRYFLLVFFVVVALSGLAAYSIIHGNNQATADARANLAVRIEYCEQIENLKRQNREDVYFAEKHYKRNLKLLGLKDTPQLRKAARESWVRTLKRNAPDSCPYTPSTPKHTV